MKNLAIIPARSGSKGLKDKNILSLCGKPLLAYSVEVALSAKIFDTVMVSTDSPTYAEIARQSGAEVPFLRESAQATDMASSWDAVRAVLQKYKMQGQYFDTVTLLQPTSPLRKTSDIVGAFTLFSQRSGDAVVSVTAVDHPIEWCFQLPENGLMDGFGQSLYHTMRRQELPLHYRENGSIYIVKAALVENKNWDMYLERCFAYLMPGERSIDIDTAFDFKLAEWMMSYEQ